MNGIKAGKQKRLDAFALVAAGVLGILFFFYFRFLFLPHLPVSDEIRGNAIIDRALFYDGIDECYVRFVVGKETRGRRTNTDVAYQFLDNGFRR